MGQAMELAPCAPDIGMQEQGGLFWASPAASRPRHHPGCYRSPYGECGED